MTAMPMEVSRYLAQAGFSRSKTYPSHTTEGFRVRAPNHSDVRPFVLVTWEARSTGPQEGSQEKQFGALLELEKALRKGWRTERTESLELRVFDKILRKPRKVVDRGVR